MLLSAGAARAADEPERIALSSADVPNLPAWWGANGRPGSFDGAAVGTGAPWTLAGHALGAWSLDEPTRAPGELPPPGLKTVHTTMSFYDSAAVALMPGGAWQGFGASLASATGVSAGPGTPRSKAVVSFRSGAFEYDEDALVIERSDLRSWLRLEAINGSRGPVGGFESAGQHLWGFAGGAQRGPNRFEGSFSQRGSSLRLIGTEEQASSGESGHLGFARRFGAVDARLTLARGRTTHESFGEIFIDPRPGFGTFLEYSGRDAQENVVAADVSGDWGTSRLGARLEWRHARVVRSGDRAFENEAAWVWGALRLERPLGDGRISMDIGSGKHNLWDAVEWAPGLSYRVASRGFEGRVGVERIVHPVWTDLAPDQAPFLQRTWAGILEAEARLSKGLNGWGRFLVGRTHDRALVARLPLEELWMRQGVRADARVYDFGLLWAGGSWNLSPVTLDGEAFLLARERSGSEPLVDPAKGFRSGLSWRFALFSGDLGVTLRAGLEGIGARDSEGQPSRVLPGFVTSNASLAITLLDAVISIQARNLEDQQRDEVWFDSDTGLEAVGPGREIRVAVILRLSD